MPPPYLGAADLARRGAFILFVMGHISYESSTKPLCPHLHLACIYLMLSSCVVATTSGPRLASRVAMNTEPPPSHPPSDPSPSDCGSRAKFVDVGDDVSAADDIIFRMRAPSFVDEARDAIDVLDTAGAFDTNSSCVYFGTCGDTRPPSRTSLTYLPCEEHKRMLAPQWLAGAAERLFPETLRTDANVLCRMAKVITAALEEQILAIISKGAVRRATCVVQELFVNVQEAGAWTNPHAGASVHCCLRTQPKQRPVIGPCQ